MTARVWPVDAVSGAPAYSGRALRQTSNAPFLPGATVARPLGARSGIRPGSYSTASPLVTATSTTWTLKPHVGAIDAESAAEAGPYAYALDANATGSVTAANATYARVDIVWVRIDDPAESDGSSTPAVVPGYTAGTAGPSPSAPATPARAMAIAQINVPVSGGGSPTVTMVAPSLPLHIIPVRTSTEMNALDVTGATTLTPVMAWRADTEALWRHDGTTWASITPEIAQAVASYGALWRTPTTQASAPLQFSKTGKQVTVEGGAIENSGSLTLPATGQNAAAFAVPAGCAPAEKVIVTAFITNTSAGTNTLGSLWFLDDGTVTFQTSAAISAAPAGTISVAIGGANWITP